MAGLIVDGFDTEALGLHIDNRSRGLFDGFDTGHRMGTIPGRDGQVHLSRRGQPEARRVRLPLSITADTIGQLEDRLDELKWRIEGRDIQLVFPDHPDRFLEARVERDDIQGVGADMVVPWRRISLDLICVKPFFQQSTQETIDFTSTTEDLPIGSAISLPVITLTGGWTSPVITYRDGSAVAQTVMDFTGLSMGGGDTLIVDCDQLTILLSGAPAEDQLVGPLSSFVQIDPQDASGWTGGAPTGLPTIEIAGGSGTSAVAVYRRNWR